MVGQQNTEEQIRSLYGEDKSSRWPFGDRKGKGRGTHIYKIEPSVWNIPHCWATGYF
ncbi:hypothetical protein Hanom_Chr16g01431771 [Helianthus anomalus]